MDRPRREKQSPDRYEEELPTEKRPRKSKSGSGNQKKPTRFNSSSWQTPTKSGRNAKKARTQHQLESSPLVSPFSRSLRTPSQFASYGRREKEKYTDLSVDIPALAVSNIGVAGEQLVSRTQPRFFDIHTVPRSHVHGRWEVPPSVGSRHSVGEHRSILNEDPFADYDNALDKLSNTFQKLADASNNFANGAGSQGGRLFQSTAASASPPFQTGKSNYTQGTTYKDQYWRDSFDTLELQETRGKLFGLNQRKDHSSPFEDDSAVQNSTSTDKPERSLHERLLLTRSRKTHLTGACGNEFGGEAQHRLGQKQSRFLRRLPEFEPTEIPVDYRWKPYQKDIQGDGNKNIIADDMDTYLMNINFGTPTSADFLDLRVGVTQVPNYDPPHHPYISFLCETIISGRPTPEHRAKVVELVDFCKQLYNKFQSFINETGCGPLVGNKAQYDEVFGNFRRESRSFNDDQKLRGLDLLGELANLEYRVLLYGQESGCFDTSYFSPAIGDVFEQRCMWNQNERQKIQNEHAWKAQVLNIADTARVETGEDLEPFGEDENNEEEQDECCQM